MNDQALVERIARESLARAATSSRARDGLRAGIQTALSEVRPPPRWLAVLRMAVMRQGPVTGGPTRAARFVIWPSPARWILIVGLLAAALAASAALVGTSLVTPVVPIEAPSPEAPIAQRDAARFAFVWRGDLFTVRADGTDRRQLTSGPAKDANPSWSPDGTRIAFERWSKGEEAIVVMDLAGGDELILATAVQPDQNCASGGLAWSPDATALIFQRNAGLPACAPAWYDLFVVAADGSSPAVLLLRPKVVSGMVTSSAAWSPDGTRIALVGDASVERTAGGGGRSHEDHLYLIEVPRGGALAGGLDARRITGRVADGKKWGSPRWSPDGTMLAATHAEDIYVMQPDGSGVSRLMAGSNPRWSPDGRQIAFRGGDDSTWLMASDGTGKRRLEPADRRSRGFALTDWSPDGTRLAGMAAVAVDGLPEPKLAFVTVDGGSLDVFLEADPQDPMGSWQPIER